MKHNLHLVYHPVQSLHKRSARIDVFDLELKNLATRMGQAMHDFNGVGLAAPQIGENVRLVVVTDGKEGYTAYVNPEITFVSKDKKPSEEGCLSVPDVFGLVPRAVKIRFKYQDLDGNWHVGKAKGMEAIIVQHEVDHLNGKLFLDTVMKITEGQDKLKKMESLKIHE